MQNKFEGHNTFKILTVQSLPMALAYIITATSSIVVYAMLKGMPDMSVYALSIAGYAGVLVIRNIIAAIFDGAFTAGTVLVAEAYGKQDRQRIWDVSVHMFFLCLISSIVLSVAMFIFGYPLLLYCTSDTAAAEMIYSVFAFMILTTPLWVVGMMLALLLRGVGDVRYSSIMNMVGAAIFVLLAFVLISRYGVMGAAVASVISFAVVNTIFYLVVILSDKSAIKPLGKVKYDHALIVEALKLAWPISIRSLVEQAGATILVSSISHFGVVFLAAWQTSKDILSFGVAGGNASYATSSAIVSARQGVRENKDKENDLKRCIRGFVCYALSVSGVVSLILIALIPVLPGWITTEAEVASAISEMIPIFIITIFFGNIGSPLSGTLQGLKRTKTVAAISAAAAIIAYWIYPSIIVAMDAGYLWLVAAQLLAAIIRNVSYIAVLRAQHS